MNSKFTSTQLVVAVLLLLGLFTILGGCGESAEHRVIFVAIDGMDYKLTRKWLDEGLLPNLAAMKKEGDFRSMGTSIPPESPVAWSNFISGQNPGGHGIYDFLHHKWEKDPETGATRLMPVDPIVETEDVGLSLTMLGRYFPLTGGTQINMRQGTAFWEILEDHGVPATIYKIPAHYPPTETGQQTMSGMGTPDFQGGYGTYYLYTEDQFAIPGNVTKGVLVANTIYDNVFRDFLYGPPNASIAVEEGEIPPEMKVPFCVYIDPERPIVKIEIGEDEDDAIPVILAEGEWSDFIAVDFEVIPYVTNLSGLVRFYLAEVRPNFRLFVDPINIDPLSPSAEITTPSGWSAELADRYGLFETKGMPENTAALKDGVLSYDEYRAHSMLIYEKRKEMLHKFIEDHDSGFLFYYFCSIDLDQHMFWALMDEKHPFHDKNESDYNKNFIKTLYQDIDGVIGEVRRNLREGDTLIVMSDHGFAPFYRTFNLNSWLLEKGYLHLKEGADRAKLDELDFDDVDWSRTQAYGIGFASLYLNVVKRDPEGIVKPAEVDSLVDEICGRLMTEKDPENGEPLFYTMYKGREVYDGAAIENAPDMVVGFFSGYGVSDKSALGEFSSEILQDNMNPWSGNHLMAAEEVPGILFVNKKMILDEPKLYDLTVTILKEYGVEKTPEMIGKPIW